MPKKIDIKDLLPKKPKVNGAPIKLKIKESVMFNGSSVMALYRSNEKVIEISRYHATPENVQETFNHELFHAVSRSISLEQVVPIEIEEIIVDTFSRVISENFYLVPKD